MDEPGFAASIGIVLAAAVVGGLAARALRLAPIVGYIAAGLVFGPETPGSVARPRMMQDIAELGVILLMFSLGVRFSIAEVVGAGRAIPLVVVGQVLLCVPLGLVMSALFDLT